ncbi:MAG: hypothetical protein ACRC1T_13985 [Clostridium chrysemydis]|uniref:hypothetical protein n=1 Tax=Clostridium TaxID=1485 RepID=UPI0021530FB6|nr:hypothetical protein [Clostridium sp. LY3-2]MCR6514701.1 hypothetical protein [Clostridium sp. LY3-2]
MQMIKKSYVVIILLAVGVLALKGIITERVLAIICGGLISVTGYLDIVKSKKEKKSLKKNTIESSGMSRVIIGIIIIGMAFLLIK